jgi:hypothetical protein
MARRLARHGIKRRLLAHCAPSNSSEKLYTETTYGGHGQIMMLRFYFCDFLGFEVRMTGEKK